LCFRVVVLQEKNRVNSFNQQFFQRGNNENLIE
jgi:hypothetical protein